MNNAQMQEIPDGGNQYVKISAKEFAAKYNSKYECYNFLACDVGVYLPHYESVTIYFLKDLIGGKKKTISCKLHASIHIPQ